MNDLKVGDDVKVISGDHEGRAGRVVYTRDVSMMNRDPELYAIIEFQDANGVDQISVPARRCAPRR